MFILLKCWKYKADYLRLKILVALVMSVFEQGQHKESWLECNINVDVIYKEWWLVNLQKCENVMKVEKQEI